MGVTIENLGFIYEDSIVSEAVSKQTPFIIQSPGSNVSICVNHIARRLLNMDISDSEGGLKKFISGLFAKN